MKHEFSLVEMMVVLAIIAILISFLLPGLGRARDSARTAECLSRQRQVSILMEMSVKDRKNRFYSPDNTRLAGESDALGLYIGNYVNDLYQSTYGKTISGPEEVFVCPISPQGKPKSPTDSIWGAFATRTVWKGLEDPSINLYKFINPSATWMFGDGYKLNWQKSIFRMNEEGESDSAFGYPHMRHNKGKATTLTYLDGHGEVTKWSKLKELDFTAYVPYGSGTVKNEL